MTDYLKVSIKNLRNVSNMNISIKISNGVSAVCGINGVGKSTLFSVLSRTVYKNALRSYFSKDGSDQTEIVFEFNGKTNIWKKKINWVREDDGDGEIFFSGIYEASIIFGNRFSDAQTSSKRNSLHIKPIDLCDADDFIYKNLGKILKNSETYYEQLKKVKSKKRASELGFKGIPYVLYKNGETIHQTMMSSGEFLLLGLLSYIYDRVKYNNSKGLNQISLILLDEAELALHPSAQDRLIIFLNKLSREENLCVVFSTHSTQILGSINPRNIFYLDNSIDNSTKIVNPCYPAYASRTIYRPDGFDFVILVEDDLAKNVVDKILNDEQLKSGRLIRILSCGGWEKVLDLHKELQISKLAGDRCQIISILDADIRDQCEQKASIYGNLKKTFLPIESIEKFIYKNAITSPNQELIRAIGDQFFTVRPFQEIISDYSSDARTKPDSTGKNFFNVMVACAEEQGIERIIFKTKICEFIAKSVDTNRFSSTVIRLLT